MRLFLTMAVRLPGSAKADQALAELIRRQWMRRIRQLAAPQITTPWVTYSQRGLSNSHANASSRARRSHKHINQCSPGMIAPIQHDGFASSFLRYKS
jgi:hypothetical protein